MATIKKIASLIALSLAGSVMYVYPYIRYVFHIPLMETLNINDFQAGLLITIYGIVSICLYIPGGILADKLNAKKPLLLSILWGFLLLGIFAYVLTLDFGGPVNYFCALTVWALMPFASTFVFWSCLVKALTMLGKSFGPGRVFGYYFAINAIFGTLVSFSNMAAFENFGFSGVTISVAVFMCIAGIAILLFFKEETYTKDITESFNISQVPLVLKDVKIWLAGILMMLVYMMFTTTTYFTPYMTTICGLSQETAGVLSIIRTYLLMIFAAIFSGVIADKIFCSTLRWYKSAGICMLVSTILFMLFGFSGLRDVFGIEENITLIAVLSLIPGFFSTMIYAIQFSVLSELNLKKSLIGTATGLTSMFVFSPDIYFNTALGAVLDISSSNNNSEAGYMIIFLILLLLCVAIIVLSVILYRYKK